jgi:hypothetical protein
LRYVYCCFDGARWIVYDLAPAGYGLTDFTPDYSALAALHPTDPRTVYVATNHDPSELASSPTEHIELYRGRTVDGGRHWRWEALTRRSGYDNIRPVVRTIPDENRAAILWMRGDYRSMWDFDTSIVGSFDDAINN